MMEAMLRMGVWTAINILITFKRDQYSGIGTGPITVGGLPGMCLDKPLMIVMNLITFKRDQVLMAKKD